MILAMDVQYNGNDGFIAGVSFNHWRAKKPDNIYTSHIKEVGEYIPGQFYKRELPCIQALLEEHALSPDIIVIDGYVYLDGKSKPGLGKYLYDSLKEKCIIIGVAKNSFEGIDSTFEIYRGCSRKPLYLTCIGEDLTVVKEWIVSMDGEHRIPTLLKKADQVCRLKS